MLVGRFGSCLCWISKSGGNLGRNYNPRTKKQKLLRKGTVIASSELGVSVVVEVFLPSVAGWLFERCFLTCADFGLIF